MKTVFYGHACLKVIPAAGSPVLMDPWFARDGAFFQSWFQYPENAPLLTQALSGVRDVCVSHNHADHLDPSVLLPACAADPLLKIHVPRYQTGFLMNRVLRLVPSIRERFVEHEAWVPFQAGGVEVFFVPEESPGSVDSAMIAREGGASLVNLNDSRLTSEQLDELRKRLGSVGLLALQCSGASEYPVTYSYEPARMRAASVQKRADKFAHCAEIITRAAPQRVLFFAGPPVFLEPAQRRFNDRGDASVFPDALDVLRQMEQAHPKIAAKTFLAVPGEELEDRLLWPKADLSAPRLRPYVEREAYIAGYAARRADLPAFDWGTPPPPERQLAYFSKMPLLSEYLSAAIGGELEFVAKGREQESRVTVDFAAKTARLGAAKAPLYVLTFPASCLEEVIAGRRTWDDVFLSLRMTFDERADRFVAHFKTLLRYMDPALFSALERYEKALHGHAEEVPMFEAVVDGRKLLIQRRCPHAGTDLEHHGRIDPEDGTITCLAHRFCFDLKTGDCLNARGYRLKVSRGQ